ncbi:MAG: dihydrofolate reductase [Methylococcales bacterium]|nr:dihydrofolate reductase [Methylococcales bacterium]
MKISLIVAMSSNRAIGVNGKMPWHLPADLKRFKQITMGHPVIMGRKTFEAIGKPLPGRRNIILSSQTDYRRQNCMTVNEMPAALKLCADSEEAFVIGGASLYQALITRADFLYLTEICKAFDGDTFFPEIDYRQWQELERQEVDDDRSVDFKYRFLKYRRLPGQNDI